MEDLIIDNPQKYLKEPDLNLVTRQYSIGNYRFDLLFEDRHHGKLIVEIQRGTLDRNHTYKILDYFDEYKKRNPSNFIDLMIVANKITRERRDRLKSYGISFFEIPESTFLDDPNWINRKQAHTKIDIAQQNVTAPLYAFNKLLERGGWKNECTKKTELTLHRKQQLVEILKKYDGKNIPFVHFEQSKINDPKLRNSQIYPVICAYHMGYFNISNDSISLSPTFTKEFHQLFPELANMQGVPTKSDQTLLSSIRQQQPDSLYLKFIDTDQKINFIETIHSLLSQEDSKIERIFNKKEITYTNGTKFGCIVPQKSKIVIGPLLVKYNELKDPPNFCRNISDKTYSSGGEVRADFTEPYSNIEYAFSLLKLSLGKT